MPPLFRARGMHPIQSRRISVLLLLIFRVPDDRSSIAVVRRVYVAYCPISSGSKLGDGTTVQANSAVRVSGLTSVSAIAAGNDHSLAVKADGTAWAWGNNSFGQLGDGTTINRGVPTRVIY